VADRKNSKLGVRHKIDSTNCFNLSDVCCCVLATI